MATLRLRADHPAVDVFHPAGHFESLPVEPGETVEVAGSIVGQTGDCVVIGTNDNDARGWPLAVWELVEEKPSRSKSADSSEGK